MSEKLSEDLGFDPYKLKSPAFIVDERLIEKNLKVLEGVKKRSSCKILLALKAFSMFPSFPLIRKSLDGICASSVHEARLGKEDFGKEVHSFAAAFSERDIRELCLLSDHLIFNSFSQWERFKNLVKELNKSISCGIRVNPERSLGEVELYDPCAPNSRLGVKIKDFRPDLLEGIEGLHFHALCEQNSHELELVLESFIEKFGPHIKNMKWVNFGGGHHITRKDYDIDKLCLLISNFKEEFKGIEVYLEPGEAVVLNTGFFISEILDINGSDKVKHAILDSSAACHMPDVIEMPYRPYIISSGKEDEKEYNYHIGGTSCLAGDRMGSYSFDKSLKVGERLVFTDMAHYSMVKTNTFNGIALPYIYRIDLEGKLHLEGSFSYEDFKNRLGNNSAC